MPHCASGIARALAELVNRLVEDEGRRDYTAGAVVAEPRGLPVQRARVGLQAFEVGLGIGRSCDRVVAVQEVRHLNKGARVLRDHVGGVAVGDLVVEDRHVPIGKRVALRCQPVGGIDHGEIEPGRCRQPVARKCRELFSPVTGNGRRATDTLGGAIGQSRLEAGSPVLVDSKGAGALGIFGEQLLCGLGKECSGGGLGRLGRAEASSRRDEAWQASQCGQRSAAQKDIATV